MNMHPGAVIITVYSVKSFFHQVRAVGKIDLFSPAKSHNISKPSEGISVKLQLGLI